jgi:hypothetical protein
MIIEKAKVLTVNIVSVVLVMFTLSLPTSVKANGASTLIIPISVTGTPACINEPITYAGVIHLNTNAVNDGNGGFHAHTVGHSTAIQGVGLISGSKYIGTMETIANIHISPDGQPFVALYNFELKFRGLGTAPDYILRIQTHVTINANGETTGAVYNQVYVCG